MPKKAKQSDPLVEAASAMVRVLAEHRAGGSRWLTWRELIERVPGLRSEIATDALKKVKPKGRVIVAFSADPNSPVLLSEDVESFVTDSELLKTLVHRGCRAEQPEIKLSALAKQLPKDLQARFVEAWQLRLARKPEVDFADMEPAGSAKKPDVLLRDRRFPRAEVVLAENLVKVLTSQKALGGTSYPSTWSRLIELTDAQATQAVRAKAKLMEPYRSRVVVSFNASDAPLALTGDEALLGDSPPLLSMVLATVRTNDNQAVDVSKLVTHKGLHPTVKPYFQTSIERQIAERRLPAGTGALKIGKKWYLFRWDDVIGTNPEIAVSRSVIPMPSAATDAPPRIVDSAQFARDFDAAFEKLDGTLGLRNYASLVDLRPALAQYPSEVFEKEVLKLRQVGHYSLSVAEGRFGLSDEERAACLIVNNVQHLLVHKN